MTDNGSIGQEGFPSWDGLVRSRIDAAEIDRELRSKANLPLRRRWDLAFWLVLGGILSTAVGDWFSDPNHVPTLYVVLAAQLLALVGFWRLVRAVRLERHAYRIALCAVIVVCALTGLSGYVRNDIAQTVAFLLVICMGVGMLPWGVRLQLIVVAAAVSISVALAYAVRASFGHLIAPFAFPVGLGFIISIFAAREIERHRRSFESRNLQLRWRSAALDSVANGVVIADRQGRIQWVNRALSQLTGYAPAEMIGHNPRLFKSGLQDEAFYQRLWNTVLAGQVWHGELVNRRKDGSLYAEEMTITPVANASGVITHFICIKQDVTRRKQIEEAVQHSEARFRSLIEHAPDLITIISADGTILYDSPSHARVLGHTPGERAGTNALELLHPEDAPRVLQTFAEGVREPGASARLEYRYRHKDGSWRHMEAVGTNLLADPAVGGVVVNSRDVTGRKLAEEALRKSEAQLREAQRIAQLGSWQLDLVTNALLWSDEIYRIFEIDPAKFGASYEAFLNLVHPDDRDNVDQAFRSAVQNGLPYDVVHRLHFPDGRVKYVHERAETTYGADGTPLRSLGTVQDITERKQMEMELRGSEAYLKALFEYAPDAHYLNDADGVFVDGNRACEELTGYKREELLGRSFVTLDLIVPGERENVTAMLPASLHQPLGPFEVVLKRKDGQRITAEIRTIPVEIKGRTLVLGIARDISERKRAEAVARLLAAIVESSEDAIVGKTLDGIVTSWNAGAERVYGYTAEEMIGRSMAVVMPPGQEAELSTLLERIRRGEHIEHLETVRLRKDGSRRDVWLTLSPIVDAAGAVIGASSIARDITERHRIEQALRDSEERFRAISASAQDSIIVIDNDGRVSFWNQAAEKTFGYTEDEALGKDVHRLLAPPVYAPRYTSGLATFRQTGQGPAVGAISELTAVHKNGTEFPLELSVSAVRLGGTWQAVGIARDVTDRKRAETQLREAKEAAEAASRVKSEFVANMSHEIRTPMNGIIGMTELALGTELTAEQREYLEMVKSSADSLLSVINDVLDFSKIEAGKLSLEHIGFDPHQICLETIKALQLRADEKGLTLSCAPAPGLPTALVGDPGRLRQILFNLIGNALKFTDRGGVMVRLTVDAETADFVELHGSVADSGIGISAEQQERIFGAFEQGDSSMTRRYGGTGLGLPITSKLVRLMGGRLWVESGLGAGSTFHFTLRLERAATGTMAGAPALLPSATAAPEPARALHVLLAEDNLVNQRLAMRLLEKHGCRVTVASNGAQVLAAVERQTFDVILMDVQMPDIDGCDAAKCIRERERSLGGGHVPIIALTAHALKGDRERCLQAGMDGYVAKPVDAKRLLAAIAAVMPVKDATSGPTDRAAAAPEDSLVSAL